MRYLFRFINQPFDDIGLRGSGIDGARRGTGDSRSDGSVSRSGGSACRYCGGQFGKGRKRRFRGGASTLRGEIADQGAATNLSSASLGGSEAARHRSAEKLQIRERRQISPRRRSAIPAQDSLIPDRHAFIPLRHALIPKRQQFIPASSLDVCEDLILKLYRSRPLHRKEN
jgi:hypothetical protein